MLRIAVGTDSRVVEQRLGASGWNSGSNPVADEAESPDAPIRIKGAAQALPLDDQGFVLLVEESYPRLRYTRTNNDAAHETRHEWRCADSGQRSVLVLRANGQHTVEQSEPGCYERLLELATLWFVSADDVDVAAVAPVIPNLVGARLEQVFTVPSLDHSRFREVLASGLPGVEHFRCVLPSEDDLADEHVLVHAASASAVRLVVTTARMSGRNCTWMVSAGPRQLYEEVLALMERWERGGRIARRGASDSEAEFTGGGRDGRPSISLVSACRPAACHS